jgi:hypothetical protein
MNTSNKELKETMSPCLVQQLFRQKIGKGLDHEIVDDILFPMLFSPKHPSKDLLLDIKMTRRWDQHSDSMIALPWWEHVPDLELQWTELSDLQQRHASAGQYHPEKNMSPFTLIPPTLESVRAEQEVAEKERLGKVNSRFRREMTVRKDWGTVDILNELRELKHPLIECHPVPDSVRHVDEPWEIYPKDTFPADSYIRLEETSDSRLREIASRSVRGSHLYSNDKMLRNKEKAIIKADLEFVNRYLEHSLSNGGLCWLHLPLRLCSPSRGASISPIWVGNLT